jgi:hypothetical protein
MKAVQIQSGDEVHGSHHACITMQKGAYSEVHSEQKGGSHRLWFKTEGNWNKAYFSQTDIAAVIVASQKGIGNIGHIKQYNEHIIAIVRQEGSFNLTETDQYSDRSKIYAEIHSGIQNEVHITQDYNHNFGTENSKNNACVLVESGDRNSINILQEGYLNRVGSVLLDKYPYLLNQKGVNKNHGLIINGNQNKAEILQSGFQNSSTVEITGNKNSTFIKQEHIKNTAQLNVCGDGNFCMIFQ